MIEIRAPEESDRQSIVDLMRVSFNVQPAWVRQVGPEMRLDRFRCAYEAGRLLAMAQVYDLTQWFGGRGIPMAGIAAVAALPERREAGLAPQVMRHVLLEARKRGALMSTLYPSRAPFYRRLGYEYSGTLTQHRVSVNDLPDLPPGGEGRLEELRDSDMEGVRACYRLFASQQSGLVGSEDEDWWRLRVIRRWNADVTTRAVVVRGPSGVEGYAAFQLESLPDTWGFRITCSHLVGVSPTAVVSLLSYFRSFRGVGQVLAWYGRPNEPVGLLMRGGAESIQTARTVRFMSRLLDVAGALEVRGYPQVSGSATIAVEDDVFPENEGPFRIEAADGRVRVSRVDGPLSRKIPIGVLSSLFTGYASATDLVRLGLLDGDDPSLRLLSALFAGPPPWITDFF